MRDVMDQMAQGQHPAGGLLLKHNGVAAAAVHQGGQKPAITTQGWILAMALEQADATGAAPSPAHAAAGDKAEGHQSCQPC